MEEWIPLSETELEKVCESEVEATGEGNAKSIPSEVDVSKVEVGKQFCTQCGNQLSSDSLFCPQCGTALQDTEAEGATVVLPLRSGVQTLKKIGVIVGIIVLIMIALFVFANKVYPVMVVKSGSFIDHPNLTIAEGIENFVGDPEWTSFKDECGRINVDVIGDITWFDMPAELLIRLTFFRKGIRGVVSEGAQFNVTHMEINNVPLNIFERGAVIEKIFD